MQTYSTVLNRQCAVDYLATRVYYFYVNQQVFRCIAASQVLESFGSYGRLVGFISAAPPTFSYNITGLTGPPG